MSEQTTLFQRPGGTMLFFGWLFLLAGAVGTGAGLAFDTSVPNYTSYGTERTVNISLMQAQTLIVHVSLAAVIVGILLLGFGSVVKSIRKSDVNEKA